MSGVAEFSGDKKYYEGLSDFDFFGTTGRPLCHGRTYSFFWGSNVQFGQATGLPLEHSDFSHSRPHLSLTVAIVIFRHPG